jgi:hypothetical protein
MKLFSSVIVAAALLSASAPAYAQESSYKPGSVWESSYIKVLPGQFENYLDYLATSWKKVQELGKKEGAVVDYHVLSTNNARQGEPDLILIVEYRDYRTTAQQEALRAKVNAMLAQNDRTATAASAARGPMRELLGSREYQELKLK